MARRNQDRGQQMFKDAPASEADWDEGSAGEARGSTSASPRRDIIALRAPAREAPPATERPAEPAEKTERPSKPGEKEAEPGQKADAEGEKSSEKPRKGWLRRHPFLAVVGLVALLLVGGGGIPLLGSYLAFRVDRRRLHRGAPIRDRAQGRGLRHGGSGHRQPACRQGRHDRPDRPARLPRGARAGRGPSQRRRKPASTTSTRRSPRKTRRSLPLRRR